MPPAGSSRLQPPCQPGRSLASFRARGRPASHRRRIPSPGSQASRRRRRSPRGGPPPTPAPVADLTASPGAGVWLNSGNLASASIAGGLIQLDHDDGSNDDWWGSTVTAPLYAWEIERPPDQALYVETHVA